MRCTAKKTVSEIVKTENHYCIGLKGNQSTLLKRANVCAQTQIPLSQYHHLDTSHGRVVNRRMQVFLAPTELTHQWAGLTAFVAVERSGIREGKVFQR